MAAMAPLVNAAGPEIVASLRLLPAGLVVLASVPVSYTHLTLPTTD